MDVPAFMDAVDRSHLYYGLDKWANGCRVASSRLADAHRGEDARPLPAMVRYLAPAFNDSPIRRRASFKSVKIVYRHWKKAIIVRGNECDPVARRTRE